MSITVICYCDLSFFFGKNLAAIIQASWQRASSSLSCSELNLFGFAPAEQDFKSYSKYHSSQSTFPIFFPSICLVNFSYNLPFICLLLFVCKQVQAYKDLHTKKYKYCLNLQARVEIFKYHQTSANHKCRGEI